MSFKEYEVIAIPNSNTILINYGLSKGSKRGQTLRIIEKALIFLQMNMITVLMML